MKNHVLDEASLLVSKNLAFGFNPASNQIKRLVKNFSRLLMIGLWALGISCGVCAEPFAYIANNGTPGITVFDTATNSVVSTIPQPALNVVVSPDGSLLYASSGSAVSIISTATHAVVATVPVGPSTQRVALSPDGAFLYATVVGEANIFRGYVAVISTATRQVTATVPLEYAPAGIEVSPDGVFVYVVNGAYFIAISTATNTVAANVLVGYEANNLAVSPDGAFVYVTRSIYDAISIISTATNTVVGLVRSNGASYIYDRSGPLGLAFSPDGAFLYVANFNAQNISKIDIAAREVTERLPSGGSGPTGVGVTPDGAFLYVANKTDNTVSIISVSTRAVVSTVKVGQSPSAFGRFFGPLPVGTALAVEGATFTVGASTIVRFGAGTQWIEKKVIGTATCSNTFFGTDPAPGILKSCVVGAATTAPPTPGSSLASEGATFAVNAATLVKYGTSARWIEKTVTGTGTCSNAFFGNDPAPGFLKSCVVGDATKTSQTPGLFLAGENATFSVGTTTLVRYGTYRRWVEKTVTGTGTCSNAFFGSDPAPGYLKSCVISDPTTQPQTMGLILAHENDTFSVKEASIVIYGFGNHWVDKTISGTVNCDNAFFGIDPAPGILKYCVFLKAAATLR